MRTKEQILGEKNNPVINLDVEEAKLEVLIDIRDILADTYLHMSKADMKTQEKYSTGE